MSAIKKIIEFFIPPLKWRAPVIIILGIILGLGAQIGVISNAPSYLTDNPKACVNCHIMNSYYSSFEHSSHARDLVCNDCHVPHDNIIRKYWFKANDGLRHATIFTLRKEPQAIMIKDAGKGVVQENCIRCHSKQISEVSAGQMTIALAKKGEGMLCWDCHREVPHGRVNSLSSTPYSYAPQLKPTIPSWMKK